MISGISIHVVFKILVKLSQKEILGKFCPKEKGLSALFKIFVS
tara:strand:- start:59473 stop:59601 length:129 start_codon:yes stop_codon:yes gene_type:complete